VKDASGYTYDNVTFPHEAPSYVFASMAESRIPEAAVEEFAQIKGIMASLNIKSAAKTRINNGVISWPGEKLTIPSIGTEVYLRIIEDRLLNDPETKGALLEKTRIFLIQKVRNVLNALD
jgi:hypothetical protein